MHRVLIVEDDTAQSFLIDMMLSRGGYQAVIVGRADEALRLLARDSAFDVILSDYRMPGMDGVDFLRQVNNEYPHIPVIIMTVHAGTAWVDDALAQGAAATLAKPFSGPELIETLEFILRQQTQFF